MDVSAAQLHGFPAAMMDFPHEGRKMNFRKYLDEHKKNISFTFKRTDSFDSFSVSDAQRR